MIILILLCLAPIDLHINLVFLTDIFRVYKSKIGCFIIPTDRYCHSGPGNGDNSIVSYALLSWTWGSSMEVKVFPSSASKISAERNKL